VSSPESANDYCFRLRCRLQPSHAIAWPRESHSSPHASSSLRSLGCATQLADDAAARGGVSAQKNVDASFRASCVLSISAFHFKALRPISRSTPRRVYGLLLFHGTPRPASESVSTPSRERGGPVSAAPGDFRLRRFSGRYYQRLQMLPVPDCCIDFSR